MRDAVVERWGANMTRKGRVAVGVLLATIAAACAPAHAHGQACDPVMEALGQCTTTPPPPPPAPDPGGSESPDQPVAPAGGKAWGFNLGYAPRGESPQQSLDAMSALKVTHYRFAIHWAGVLSSTASDPVGPEMRSPIGSLPADSGIAHWDRTYLDLRARGITPILIVMDAPRWASTKYRCADSVYALTHGSECPSNWRQGIHHPHPDFYGHFRQFVAAVAQRYPEAIIEGHNEPDLAWELNYSTRVDSTTAGAIQCQLHQAVRSVDARTVLSMAVTNADYARGFVARAKGCYTGYSFHPYPGGTEFGAGTQLARLFEGVRSARAAAGDTAPIWVTETGYSFVPSTTDAAHNAYWEDRYADASRRLYNKLATMDDVRAVMFHTLRDRADQSGAERHFGFARVDWSPKPRMCTFVGMASSSWPGC